MFLIASITPILLPMISISAIWEGDLSASVCISIIKCVFTFSKALIPFLSYPFLFSRVPEVSLINIGKQLYVFVHTVTLPLPDRLSRFLPFMRPKQDGANDRRSSRCSKNRLVLRPSLGESLLTPRVPVHGIIGVMTEIRACLAYEPVGCGILCIHVRYHRLSLRTGSEIDKIH